MRVGSSLTPQNCQVTKMNSYNTKQLDTVYTIKKKLLEINFWNDMVNNYFHDFEYSIEGRYVWSKEITLSEGACLEQVSRAYSENKGNLLKVLTTRQYDFLMSNIQLFHSVYRIGENLLISVI